ncbi:flagellin [Rhodobacteraceae bacterium]|nr:flagellin [Paracoccaceae bacterium]
MSLSIGTNTSAMRAAEAASISARSMETSMERLSTGKRINASSDDAAGVAIASRLSAEILGANQAIRNSLDGQALIDTAEGAHKEVENILQRMREVSVQAANDTNNDQDRANLQAEMDAMVTEIDRIASTTTWAGENLMQSATGTSFSFQVGAATGAANQINIDIDGVGAKNLGIAASSGVEVAGANAAQVAHDALVATSDAAVATAKTAGDEFLAAEAGLAALTDLKGAYTRLDSSGLNLEKQAAAIRDIMVGIDKATAAGSAAPDKTALNMDAQAVVLQGNITDYIADPTEQGNAQDKLNLFTDAIAAFKATTTDADAKDKFDDAIAAYDVVVAFAATDSASAAKTVGTITGGTAAVISTDTTPGIALIGAAKTHHVAAAGGVAHQGLGTATTAAGVAATGDFATAEAAVATKRDSLIAAENAANVAAVAVDNSTDPADLKGQDLSVATGDAARGSITTIDAAIKTVNIQRSELGAVSNRLNHTVNNLTNISSNLSAAKGGIEDADFALETTNLAKNQILQQASTAMLAQANASQQNVLALLRS